MTHDEKISYVRERRAGYLEMSEDTRRRTSFAAWISLKLSCTLAEAERLCAEIDAAMKGE